MEQFSRSTRVSETPAVTFSTVELAEDTHVTVLTKAYQTVHLTNFDNCCREDQILTGLMILFRSSLCCSSTLHSYRVWREWLIENDTFTGMLFAMGERCGSRDREAKV